MILDKELNKKNFDKLIKTIKLKFKKIVPPQVRLIQNNLMK